ncbi:Auxin response factor 20 [Raphanus sativus]|nr:Auxin response factor 20 [Raphanus sativus]
MHVQPEVLAIDETNNYLNNQLWKLCAGPLFDTPKIGEKDVEIPIPKNKNNIQNTNYFTKVLSDSDTRKNGGFVLYKRHAIECLPLLLTPSQEIIAKDIHGREWSFKHTLRGTPKRHLFSPGWNEFAKGKELVAGDYFVFLRGENGESRVGISKAPHQQHNIPTSLISKQSMHHGVVATVLNAIREKCMFVVFYKPRYNGTVVGVRDFSTHWKDSEWRSLEVQWDGAATIPRPDKVSPWEIELLTHSSPIFKSDDLKHKCQIEVNEFGQEVGNSGIQSSMSYSFPTMSKPNYNEQMVQAMKETTTTATTSCRLFGVDLTVPATTKDSIKPIDSYKKIKISKIFEEEEIVNHVQARSLTKVHMEGVIEKTVDLTIFDGYNQLIDEIERLFDIKGELHMHNQWKMFFIYDEGDMMILGDDPWPKFCNMAKEIFICSKEDVKIGIADNRFSKGDPTLTTTILPPDVNSN